MKLRHFIAAFLAVGILSGVRGIKEMSWHAPRLFPGTVLEATYVPTPIQSITAISIFLNSVTSNTQTVSVTAANSVLVFTGQSSLTVPPESAWINGVLTNGTTVTASRINSGGTPTYTATLIEFAPLFVKSSTSSTGAPTTVTLADTVASNTATITSVNTAKTLLAYTGATSTMTSVDSLTPNNAQFCRETLTNSTTVTAARDVASKNVVCGFNYVEFK